MTYDPLSVPRDLHRVSTKAAIYSPDRSRVLVMHMFKGTENEIYGLPGGHIDEGEMPDETIKREIQEELGIVAPELRHVDFFVHENGKIILAYTGTLTPETAFQPSNPAKETGAWLTRDEFEASKIEPHYKQFVLANW